MIDQEITRVIAEKVMGYPMVANKRFQPLHDDECCIAAWVRFSKGRNTTLEMRVDKRWEAIEWIMGNYPEKAAALDVDHKRAMCECIAKAVGGE